LETLSRLLRDPEPEVPSWAALSASKLGRVAITVLIAAIKETEDNRRFLYYADALLKIEVQEGSNIIRSALKKWPAEKQASLGRAVSELSRGNGLDPV
jgi:hypothetical protein